MTDDKPILIYATFPTEAEAERIGGVLLDRGLAACINIFPPMTSIYIWEGKRTRDSEVAAIVKTRASLADRVMTEVRRLHPYQNPALVVVEPAGGSADFLNWIMDQTALPR